MNAINTNSNLNKSLKIAFIIGLTLIVNAIVLGNGIGESLISYVFLVLGIEILLIVIAKFYFIRNESVKAIGNVIIIFTIINFLRHSMFFELLFRITEVFSFDKYMLSYFGFELVWLMISLMILKTGIKNIWNDNVSYEKYLKSNEYKFVMISILVLLFLEIPIFRIHGDFGGYLHGHSFWDSEIHLH